MSEVPLLPPLPCRTPPTPPLHTHTHTHTPTHTHMPPRPARADLQVDWTSASMKSKEISPAGGRAQDGSDKGAGVELPSEARGEFVCSTSDRRGPNRRSWKRPGLSSARLAPSDSGLVRIAGGKRLSVVKRSAAPAAVLANRNPNASQLGFVGRVVVGNVPQRSLDARDLGLVALVLGGCG